ncbi:hypothetical protein OK016_13095 [Vibrio chagasii]|nr:hypothetical protein [Vibrio chagasii]
MVASAIGVIVIGTISGGNFIITNV